MDSFRINKSTQVIQGSEFQQKVNSGIVNAENPRDGKIAADKISKIKEDVAKNLQKIDTDNMDIDDIQNAADKINKSLNQMNTKIQVNIDNDTGKMVIHLVNSENGEVVRKIPSDSVLKLSARIAEYIGNWPENEVITEGAVIDKKV